MTALDGAHPQLLPPRLLPDRRHPDRRHRWRSRPRSTRRSASSAPTTTSPATPCPTTTSAGAGSDLDSSLYFAGDTSKLWVMDDTVGLEHRRLGRSSPSTSPARRGRCASRSAGPTTPARCRRRRILVNDLDLDRSSRPPAPSTRATSTRRPVGHRRHPRHAQRRGVLPPATAPRSATWTVKVRARNIPQGPQPFALAAIGDVRGRAAAGPRRRRHPHHCADRHHRLDRRRHAAVLVCNFGTAEARYSVRMRIGDRLQPDGDGHRPRRRHGPPRDLPGPTSDWPRGTLAVDLLDRTCR